MRTVNDRILRRCFPVLLVVAITGAGMVRAQDRDKVTVRITSGPGGRYFCQASRAPDGWYTAKHCVTRGVKTFDGSPNVPPYSVDPNRDLAHFAGPPASIQLREPRQGDVKTATFSNGDTGHYVYERQVRSGDCYLVRTGPNSALNWCLDAIGSPAGEESQFLCFTAGRKPHQGDSGVGLVSDLDQRMAGVMTNGGPVPTPVCISGYGILAASVP